MPNDPITLQQIRNLITNGHIQALLISVLMLLLYLGIWAWLKMFIRKTGLPRQSVRFLKWAFTLTFLWLAEFFLDIQSSPPLIQQGLFLLQIVCFWLFAKHFIEDFISELWLKRIRKTEVNNITLDLVKLIVALGLTIVVLRSSFNINPGSILTSSAILTAIIGLSMQDTIGSLFSGLIIQLEKPFEIGDWISVGGQEGRVTQISWRYTRLENLDNDFIIIPNLIISKERVLNRSQPVPQLNQRTRIGVSRSEPPIKVKTALEESARRASCVDQSMPIFARLMEFGESQNQYVLSYFIRSAWDTRRAMDEINSLIWYQLAGSGIEMAYPVRDVRIRPEDKPGGDNAVLDVLRDIRLFAGLSDEDLNLLTRASTIRSYVPEANIVTRGGRDTTMFVILQGSVNVRRGEEALASLGPGGIFGEMSLLTGSPRTADVAAVDQTRCLVVDREGFRLVLERNPALLANIRDIIASRSQDQPTATGLEENHDESLFGRFRRIFF